MRTIPALACDVEEMFHTHKVTGKNASIRVRPRLETKTLCCQALVHILAATSLDFAAYALWDTISPSFVVIWRGRLKRKCKLVWRKLHKNMRTIISGLEFLKRTTTTIYFKPSVGDHGGAKVASGLVCWS